MLRPVMASLGGHWIQLLFHWRGKENCKDKKTQTAFPQSGGNKGRRRVAKLRFQREKRSWGPTARSTAAACGLLKGSATGRVKGVTATAWLVPSRIYCHWYFPENNRQETEPPGLTRMFVPTPTPFLLPQNYPLQVCLEPGFGWFHHNHSLKSSDQIH